MRLAALPDAVVFDMDGLLFDTEALYWPALRDAARAADGRELPFDLFRRLVGLPLPENRRILIEAWDGPEAVDALLDAWSARFEELAETRLAPKPGARELLDALDALGLPRAICTSSAPWEVARNLAATALEGRFHAVVARGDYARGKPAPEPYLLAAARLGVEPGRCLALEDSHNGVRSAAAAGMPTVMVPDLLEPTAEIAALCAAVAPSLHEVRRALLDAAAAAAAAARR